MANLQTEKNTPALPKQKGFDANGNEFARPLLYSGSHLYGVREVTGVPKFYELRIVDADNDYDLGSVIRFGLDSKFYGVTQDIPLDKLKAIEVCINYNEMVYRVPDLLVELDKTSDEIQSLSTLEIEYMKDSAKYRYETGPAFWSEYGKLIQRTRKKQRTVRWVRADGSEKVMNITEGMFVDSEVRQLFMDISPTTKLVLIKGFIKKVTNAKVCVGMNYSKHQHWVSLPEGRKEDGKIQRNFSTFSTTVNKPIKVRGTRFQKNISYLYDEDSANYYLLSKMIDRVSICLGMGRAEVLQRCKDGMAGNADTLKDMVNSIYNFFPKVIDTDGIEIATKWVGFVHSLTKIRAVQKSLVALELKDLSKHKDSMRVKQLVAELIEKLKESTSNKVPLRVTAVTGKEEPTSFMKICWEIAEEVMQFNPLVK